MILLILRDFNFKLKLICYYIENVFDICKDRFRLLTHYPDYAKYNVVQAIFTLSNFLVDNIGIESEEIEDNIQYPPRETAHRRKANSHQVGMQSVRPLIFHSIDLFYICIHVNTLSIHPLHQSPLDNASAWN